MKYDHADEIGFLIVQCPICDAVVGRRCWNKDRTKQKRLAHKPRRYLADGFIMGNNHRVRETVMDEYTGQKMMAVAR